MTEVLQTLLEADREAFLRGYGGRKNGYYPRKLGQPLRGYLVPAFGLMGLAIPRDREGRDYPSLLQPYARRQVDVGEVAVALYAAGVSQGKAAGQPQARFRRWVFCWATATPTKPLAP